MSRVTLGGRAAIFAVAVSLIAAGAARAAPAWLPPAPLSATGFSAEAPQVSMNARGDAVAVWARDGIAEGASRAAGAPGWEAPRSLAFTGPDGSTAPLVGIDSAGNAVAVRRKVLGGEEAIAYNLRQGPSGPWSAPDGLVTLGPEELGQTDPDLAVAAGGAGVIVWIRKGVLSAASGSTTGGFGFSGGETVSEKAIDTAGPRVAVDAAGDATVVFELDTGGKRVIASSTRPAGGKWSEPVPISEPGNVNVPGVAVNAHGDAVAVWEDFFEELGAGTMEEHIQVATRPAGASAWGAPVTLTKTESGLGEPGNQAVAIDGQGDAVAIWGRMHGPAAETIETSQDRALSSSWSAPLPISGPGKLEEAPQIAVDEAGHALIAWERQEPGGTEIVEASSGSATGVAWQPAKAVSATTPGSEAKEPDLGMDAQGDAAAAWAGLHGGFYIAEAAGYDAAGPAIKGLSIPSSATVGQALSFAVSPLDVWSALGATTWSFGDGASASGTAVSHTYAAPGSYLVNVSTADVLGNTTPAVAIVTVGARQPAGAPRPQLTGARLTHARFRVSARPTAVSARAHGRAPLGTSFRFSLNEAASVKIVFSRSAAGLRGARGCVAPTPALRHRHARRCTRILTVGRLTRAHEPKGADSVTFTGRIGTHALAPRSYTATLTATAGGLASTPSKLALTIVR